MNAPEFLLRCVYAPEEFRVQSDNIAAVGSDNETWTMPPGSSSNVKMQGEEGQLLPSDLAKAFEESEAGRDLIRQISAAKTSKESQTELPDLSYFAVSTSKQIGLLVRRGWTLVLRNPASSMRVVTAIIFGSKFF